MSANKAAKPIGLRRRLNANDPWRQGGIKGAHDSVRLLPRRRTLEFARRWLTPHGGLLA